ncbi:Lmo0850 family protein [Lysinibacillus sp. 54212]
MTKEIDLRKIVTNLSKIGVNATVTKSRLELLKVLTPPTQTPQTQNI